ncbi:hypothetical protein SISNIDRAFT_488087 [Sistotremastrum niveocremeum HHB9708]|uniref:Uncharacterized protein n=1 Tax=Sistotremastrum niveocremeum HHB9708 TaxID=1314777 RepID=A0A164RQZ7_9AGAM|nr:hypothetical protein SISNIDRAFT_488087 [Sistotremastrum niveocremeum HHB9708]
MRDFPSSVRRYHCRRSVHITNNRFTITSISSHEPDRRYWQHWSAIVASRASHSPIADSFDPPFWLKAADLEAASGANIRDSKWRCMDYRPREFSRSRDSSLRSRKLPLTVLCLVRVSSLDLKSIELRWLISHLQFFALAFHSSDICPCQIIPRISTSSSSSSHQDLVPHVAPSSSR